MTLIAAQPIKRAERYVNTNKIVNYVRINAAVTGHMN